MKIVCFGESLTSCGADNGRFSDILQARFPEHIFINRGVGGDTFRDALQRLRRDVLDHGPDVVLLEFGANDWWHAERPPSAWAADLERCVVRIREHGAVVLILGVFGPVPNGFGSAVQESGGTDARGAEFQALEAAIAARHDCGYVANIQADIVGDRCCWQDANHPNAYGNRSVADRIEPALSSCLGIPGRPVCKPALHTLQDIWMEAVALGPDRLAVVEDDNRLTYAEADARVCRVARGLCQVAPREAPVVAVLLPNCLEYYLLYWAVARLGGTIVPLSTWLKDDSLEAVFAKVRPDIVVTSNAALDRCLARAHTCGAAAVFVRESGPLPAGARSFSELEQYGAGVPAARLVDPESTAIIMHTSGTTAAPKGAIMRHSDLLFNVMTTINAHQFCAADVHLIVNPMFHCTALYSSLPTAAYGQAAAVITAESASAPLLSTIRRHRVTTVLTVPTVLQRLVSLPPETVGDCPSLRLLAYAGSPMSVGTVTALQERFPDVELHNFFGLTETISMTHVLSGEEARERPASIGRLLPFVEARIVDEAGSEAEPGVTGELVFARENVICGYYGEPDRLEAACFKHCGRTWFRTGDLAVTDEDGYTWIRGRSKGMIIVGGENVYCAEVEAVLLAHPGVREAAVCGVPATGVRLALGELIKAFVVPADATLTEKDVRRHCQARLPSYKNPHYVEFLAALPRGATGKIVRSQLS